MGNIMKNMSESITVELDDENLNVFRSIIIETGRYD